MTDYSSSRLDGYVAQVSVHVAVLKQLIHYIRAGHLDSAAEAVTAEKIVLLGHSLGMYNLSPISSHDPEVVHFNCLPSM